MSKQIKLNKKLLEILEDHVLTLTYQLDGAREKSLENPDLFMPSIHFLLCTLPKQIADMQDDINFLRENI